MSKAWYAHNEYEGTVVAVFADTRSKARKYIWDNNDNYDNSVENNHESPITSKGKTVLNAFIETSGTVGDNKIQIQAQLSDEEKDNAFYLVINDKVLDLKALIQPEAK